MNKHHLVLLTLLPCWFGCAAFAQRLTLDNAIRIAQENSYSAQVAQFSYMASYWNYRSFKAQLMPAVNLRGKVANFDHSLIETRNNKDDHLKYVCLYLSHVSDTSLLMKVIVLRPEMCMFCPVGEMVRDKCLPIN